MSNRLIILRSVHQDWEMVAGKASVCQHLWTALFSQWYWRRLDFREQIRQSSDERIPFPPQPRQWEELEILDWVRLETCLRHYHWIRNLKKNKKGCTPTIPDNKATWSQTMWIYTLKCLNISLVFHPSLLSKPWDGLEGERKCDDVTVLRNVVQNLKKSELKCQWIKNLIV